MKIHHGNGTSYKERHWLRANLQSQRFSSLSWPEAWQQAADIVLDKELRSYIQIIRQQETYLSWVPKALPIVTFFLQQDHTYSNNATPPITAAPHEFTGPFSFKLPEESEMLISRHEKAVAPYTNCTRLRQSKFQYKWENGNWCPTSVRETISTWWLLRERKLLSFGVWLLILCPSLSRWSHIHTVIGGTLGRAGAT